jgi:hypothetical protein
MVANESLKYALTRVAVRKAYHNAFREELVKIDPTMEKIAETKWQWMKAQGSNALAYAKRNPWSTAANLALTGAMFVPGLNVAAGAGRAAWLASKAIPAGVKGAQMLNAARKTTQAAKLMRGGAPKISQMWKGMDATNKGKAAIKNAFTPARDALRSAMPWNRAGAGYGMPTPKNFAGAFRNAPASQSWKALNTPTKVFSKGLPGRITRGGFNVSTRARKAGRFVGTAAVADEFVDATKGKGFTQGADLARLVGLKPPKSDYFTHR